VTPAATPSGILNIDKPEGLTSMAVCRKVRWLLVQGGAPKRIKVGHGGTLDPLATGVLVILIGKATRLCDRIMTGEKRYRAEVDLAHTSTTDDREGVLVPVPVATLPSLQAVQAACSRFVGTIEQTPPAYSAIWIDGERAYDLARKAHREQGDLPILQSRPVTIHAIDIIEYVFPRLIIDIRCGKGTYIRSLARDLGRTLATGGMLAALRRTQVGEFTIDASVPLAALPSKLTHADLLPLPPAAEGPGHEVSK
jgi:tRNA pseudouridine55 synthase